MNLKSIKLHHLKSIKNTIKNDFESHKFLWYLKKKELAFDVLGQSQESMHTIPLTNGKTKHNLKCNFFSEIKFSIPSSNFQHPLIYQVCWGASACADYSLSSKTIKKSEGNEPITSGCIWGKGGNTAKFMTSTRYYNIQNFNLHSNIQWNQCHISQCLCLYVWNPQKNNNKTL